MYSAVSRWVCGVHGDDHVFCLVGGHVVEEGCDLCDLVGVWGHRDLGDGDGVAVDHRGEQRELLVLVGPDAAEDLAVDRESKRPVRVVLGAFP
jgi:hypothetical protein